MNECVRRQFKGRLSTTAGRKVRSRIRKKGSAEICRAAGRGERFAFGNISDNARVVQNVCFARLI
jgi:hypothetical protein